jgi:uncharacterized protein (TIGR02265 family)
MPALPFSRLTRLCALSDEEITDVRYSFSMTNIGKVKGGSLQSRLEFVREHRGEEGVQRVIARLSEEDRAACAHLLTGAWYPFDLNQRLDDAIAAEMAMGDRAFLLMGEKSAEHNLTKSHRAFVTDKDPHGLLKRAAQIYQAYYDSGSRNYLRVDEHKARISTHDSSTYSRHDCLTVVGWHRKAIEMCGGNDVNVVETQCRAKGAPVCEYECEWS